MSIKALLVDRDRKVIQIAIPPGNVLGDPPHVYFGTRTIGNPGKIDEPFEVQIVEFNHSEVFIMDGVDVHVYREVGNRLPKTGG